MRFIDDITHLSVFINTLPKSYQARKDYEYLRKIMRKLEGQDARLHNDCLRCEYLGRGDPLVDPSAVREEEEDKEKQ